MLNRLIHFFLLPCSKATLLMEKRNGSRLTLKEKAMLSLHLNICKWCKAYEAKLKILDDILKRKFSNEQTPGITSDDIEDFKIKVKEEIGKR